MMTLSFDLDFEATIKGKGPAWTELNEYYQNYSSETQANDPDIIFEIKEFSPDPDKSMGDPNLYYGRESESFIIENTSSSAKISKDWSHIVVSPDSSKNTVAYLLEYDMRKQYTNSKRALIHASGIDIEGTTIIFPAWRHTGKTNLLLSLLQEFGGGYLSDDRVWIHSDGRVFGYDLPVNMMPYNIRTFGDLGSFSMKERFAAQASNIARTIAHRWDGFLPKAASFTNIFYLEPAAAKRIMVNDLFSDAEFKDETIADGVVLLQTAPNARKVELHETTKAEALRSITAASHYEWNKELEEYARVFDTLFPEEDRLAEHRQFTAKERDIFSSFLDEVQIFKLTIPREEDWSEEGIGEQTTDLIDDVISEI